MNASGAVLAGALFGGWTGPQDYMHPAGPAARGLAALGWPVLLSLLAISLAVWALLFWIALRRRGSFDEHAPANAGGGQRWIVFGGVLFPVVVLTLMFVGALQTMAGFPLAHASAVQPDIRVIGHQWWFDAQYLPGGAFGPRSTGDLDRVRALASLGTQADAIVHSPTEIHIPVGRPVEIELVSRDVIHSFWVPKLHGKVDLVPGLANRIRIQADRPGLYEGQCAEYCGVQHAHMRLLVVAQSAEEFAAWLAHQREPAQKTTSIAAGQRLFEQGPCAMCHTVRGTAAQGRVGPELTHVGSRRRIAGGSLPNDIAHLEAWITDAQSLKPGAQMPSIRQYNGTQLRAVARYLQGLD